MRSISSYAFENKKFFKKLELCKPSDGAGGDAGGDGIGGDNDGVGSDNDGLSDFGGGGGYSNYGGFVGGGSAIGISGGETNVGMGNTSDVAYGDIGETSDVTSVAQSSNPAHAELSNATFGGTNVGGIFGGFSQSEIGQEFSGTSYSVNWGDTTSTYSIGSSISTVNNVTGWFDNSLDNAIAVNMQTSTQVNMGTIGSHLLGVGLSAPTAIALESVTKIAIGYFTGTATIALAISAIKGINNILGIDGVYDKNTFSTIDTIAAIAAIGYQSFSIMKLGSQLNNPAILLAGVLNFVQGINELGISEINSVDFEDSCFSNVHNGDWDGVTTDLSSVASNNPITSGVLYLSTKFLQSGEQLQPIKDKVDTNIIKSKFSYDKGVIVEQYIYKDFRGGLNTVVSPHLINPNEGIDFKNIDINSYTMKTITKGTIIDTVNTDINFLYYINNIKVTNDVNLDITKLGIFYFTLDKGILKRFDIQDNTTELTVDNLVEVTIPAPVNAPVLSNVINNYTYDMYASLINIKDADGNEETYTASLDKDFSPEITEAIQNGSSVILTGTCSSGTPDGRTVIVTLEGKQFTTTSNNEKFSVTIQDLSYLNTVLDREQWDEYQYAITYYNKNTGYESAPKFTENWIRKTKEVSLSNIPQTSDTNVTHIRIYRIGGYSSVYRLIKELENNPNSSITLTYNDYLDDYMSNVLLDTENIETITGLNGLITHKGSLFAYKENMVYFSRPGKPNAWSEFNMVRVGESVTGLASTPLGLLIFTEYKSYLLSGTDKYNFALSAINNSTGCINHKSISYVKNAAIWQSHDGIMVSSGTTITNVTRNKIKMDNFIIKNAVVVDNIYYGICENNQIFIADFNFSIPTFRIAELSDIETIKYLTVKDNKLCGLVGTDIYYDMLNPYINTTDEISLYTSPHYIAGNFSKIKEFAAIEFVYRGLLEIDVFIDDNQIDAMIFDDLTSNIDNELKSVRYNLPTELNEGYKIYFTARFRGELIEYRFISNFINNI